MATIDEQIAALQAEIAAAKAVLQQPDVISTPSATPGYGVKQFAFDVPTGATKAFAGLLDLISYPGRVMSGGIQTPVFPASTAVATGAEKIAEALGVAPQTEQQRFIEFITPIPGPGKARMLGDALYGGLAWAGMKGGELIDPDSAAIPLIASLAAPALPQATISGARALASKAAPGVRTLLGNEAALREEAAKEILREIGPEGVQALQQYAPAAPITGAGDIPLTIAERTQLPQAAAYQTAIQQKKGGGPLVEALIQRQAKIDEELAKVAPVPEQGVMATALGDIATTAAEAKVGREAQALQALGFTPEQAAITPMERGEALQESLMQARAAAKVKSSNAWAEVDKTIKLDASKAFDEALASIKEIGPEVRKTFSAGTNSRIAFLETIQAKARGRARGALSLADMQDLRSATLQTLREVRIAKGAEGAEQKVLSDIVRAIDGEGVTALKDGEKISKWYEARQATREYKQKFAEGVVGEITALKGYEPKLKTSQVISRALRFPENAQELLRKFGTDSIQATELRMDLLSRLSQQNKPANFILKNKDTFRAAFKEDYAKVLDYARARNTKTGFEQFQAIKDSAISGRIFESAKTTEAFTKQFKTNRQILDMARGKFIDERVLKRGQNALENLDSNRSIAKVLFGDELPKVEAILRDQKIAQSPGQLRKAITGGNSITTLTRTALGALSSGRAIINVMKSGRLAGAITGASGGPIGAITGAFAGAFFERLGQQREEVMDAFVSQMLADPRLLDLAAAPPTRDNIERLAETALRYGFIGTKVDEEAGVNTGIVEEAKPVSIDDAIVTLQSEIAEMRKQLAAEGDVVTQATPQKQSSFSILDLIGPAEAQAAAMPPEEIERRKMEARFPKATPEIRSLLAGADPLLQAIAKVESNGNPKARSRAGALGLYQMMPGTARMLGIDPSDPRQSLDGAKRYMDYLISKFDTEQLALAAYNWGEGNVAKAMRAVAKAKKMDDWRRVSWSMIQNRAPKETRNYVPKVLALRESYITRG